MNKAKLMIRNVAIGLALCVTAGATFGADVNLVPSVVGFNSPIGIDFQETSGKLILSAEYPNGLPNNLELADPTTGTAVPFSSLAGLTNELKIATVRQSACLAGSGFQLGEVFTGNGNPGQIIRINAAGTVVINPWVTLPGEAALVRGSLFQDRFNAANCDLIAVTGNEQDGTAANDNLGNVWRITSAGVASLVATIGVHLEGVTTLANLPLVYGPMAGKILAGAEEFAIPGGPPFYAGGGGKIYVIDPAGVDQWFTISAGLPTTCTPGLATPNHCNYQTAVEFHPEDLDVIRANAQFFGIAFRDGIVYSAQPEDFAQRCGQVLITQEFPGAYNPSGLSALRWNGTNAFVVDSLTTNVTVQQWEHVTFTSGNDCATAITIAKTPDNGTFNIGDQLTWTIVVTNTGLDTAGDVKLDDPLPTTGGLTWSFVSTSAGTCDPIPLATQILHCDLGNILPGALVTVVVQSSNVGGAPQAACTGQKINNIGTASATNAPTVTDPGDTTCTPPPHLKVVKTPDGGLFTQGGPISYTIEISNDGVAGSIATNVQLSDQLPTNGTLNWSAATITINPAQGSCSMSAASLLTCSLGSIAAGATNAVTVTVTLSSTPALACQSQPNPVALATASNAANAQDAGSQSCTPLVPNVTIVKFTDGADANNPNAAGVPNIAAGGTVTWTYRVTNTGQTSIPQGQVSVTDSTTGVAPTFTSEISGNNDSVFDPAEVWLYTATGTALDLTLSPPAGTTTVPNSCTAAGTQPPRTAYTNIGTVTITGASATDPSSYCNPPVVTGKAIQIGPSTMEGAIKISAGDWVNGGYSFKFKSTHVATMFTVSATVSITGACLSPTGTKLGTTDTIVVSLGTVSYAIPAGGATGWLPTGDANSVLSWQGSIIAPNTLCGGGGNKLDASKGAVFDAVTSQSPDTGSLVDFRFKFRDPAAKGKPNTNCLDTTDNPNRDKADVCGASWSSTQKDP